MEDYWSGWPQAIPFLWQWFRCKESHAHLRCPNALEHLAKSDILMMDGNFDVALRIFTQLYIIRTPIDTGSVSCVYALLFDKSEDTYQELLWFILERCDELVFQLDPTTVITDFESAASTAIKSTFDDDVQFQGCFYHLTQSTWRKIQSLGMTTLQSWGGDQTFYRHVRWTCLPSNEWCSWRDWVPQRKHSRWTWRSGPVLWFHLCNWIALQSPGSTYSWSCSTDC